MQTNVKMMRQGLIRLQNSTLREFARLCLGSQPHCTLWHSSCVWSSKTGTGDGGSSSSSDSDSDAEQGTGVDQKLKEAAEGVGRSIPGHGPAVQSDLLQQLQSFAKFSKDQASGVSPPKAATKLSDLLSGMQIQKSSQKTRAGDEYTPRQQKRTRLATEKMPFIKQQPNPDREKVKLFEGPALGIFTAGDATQPSAERGPEVEPRQPVSLWEKVRQEQLDTFTQQPPSNAFEEMIQWTKQGKLWQFPINNEQGMEEEAKVGFHQHVFLEDQIADFPRRGPIRHFMELVLVGLSRNPYLTVQQKHEHIDWFRQYFKEKQDVLQDALGEDGLIRTN